MSPSLACVLNSLNLPALSAADVTALKALQRDWERHSERMLRLQPDCAIKDQKAAYDAFLADPTEENEQRLAVLADERLTTRRYAVLHQAHAELRRRSNEKAVGILSGVLESLRQVLAEKLEEREIAAHAEGFNRRTDARCIELREALGQVTNGLRHQAEATSLSAVEEPSPIGLSALLLTENEGAKAE